MIKGIPAEGMLARRVRDIVATALFWRAVWIVVGIGFGMLEVHARRHQ